MSGPLKAFTGVLLSALLVLLWSRHISGAPIEKDAAQMVRMALNLERHGVISLDEQPPFTVTNYREPLPAILTAFGIKLIDVALGEAPAEAYFSGPRVQLLKYQNVLWLALLSLGAFWAASRLTQSFALALLSVLLVNFAVLHSAAELIDDLYTDIPAAALLMLASAAIADAYARRRVASFVVAGALFGVLTLVKAAVLYVFAGTLAVLGGIYLLRRVILTAAAARDLGLLVAAFACAVAPWMYRNVVQFGSAHISQRAGVVLMYRAVYDQMSDVEYRGTFYVWAPQPLQRMLGRLLGFSAADLDRHGRLQHLNDGDSAFAAEDLAAERAGAPERTLSYYRQARAERVKLEDALSASGLSQSEIAADDQLKSRAAAIILDHPGRELALTVSFLWRGATLAFPCLVISLLAALYWRRYDLLLFAAPAFGTVMLYALFTHFIARYDLPALSVALVAFIASLHLLLRALWPVAPQTPPQAEGQ